MGLLEMIITIALMGLIVWAVTQIPMPEPFKRAIYAISILVLVVYVLQAFGVMPSFKELRIK